MRVVNLGTFLLPMRIALTDLMTGGRDEVAAAIARELSEFTTSGELPSSGGLLFDFHRSIGARQIEGMLFQGAVELPGVGLVRLYVTALSVVDFRRFSARGRNTPIASSSAVRRCSCSCMELRCSAARRRSVMSSCVSTHPPPCIGRFARAMMRPSFISCAVLVIFPCAIRTTYSVAYRSELPEKVPAARQCSSRSRSEQPGMTCLGVNP